LQEVSENYSNPKTCLFHVLFKVPCLFLLRYAFIKEKTCEFVYGDPLYVYACLIDFEYLCLKAGALAFYILSALFVHNFVIIFVVTVFLAALDFWVVKNVSGRILVGLRWWNEINDEGNSVWMFECLDEQVCIFLLAILMQFCFDCPPVN
jgi:hypothetical protein